MTHFRIGLAIVLIMNGWSLLQAQEWTRFRGPNGSGLATGLKFPTEWKESDIAWKVTLPAKGHSSPVLWGEKIFLTGADSEQGTRYVFCLNTQGKLLWSNKYEAAASRIHAQNSFASSTPSCDADAVYVAWATPEGGLLVAIDHAGKELWRYKLPGYISRHGFGSSPVLVNDLVVITNDQDGPSSVIAVDRKSGQVRWQVDHKMQPEQNASYATPILYQPDPNIPPQLLIASWGNGLSCLNPTNGATIWEQAVFKRRPVGSLIWHKNLILGNCGEGGGDNSVVAVQPSPNNTDPKLVYTIDKTMAPYVPTVIAVGDLVFLWGDKGIVSCVNLQDGKKVWQQRIGGNFSSSPVIAGDQLIGIAADGEVVLLAASAEYKLLGRNKLGESTRATPALVGDRMYVRTESQLFAINGKK